MKAHLLYVGGERPPRASIEEAAERLGAFDLSSCRELEAASMALAENPPGVLLIDLEPVGCRGLELLCHLEVLELPIPVLVMAAEPTAAPPLGLSPLLTVVAADLPAEELRTIVFRQVEAAAHEGPLFRIADYLQLASLFGQSVELQTRCGRGRQGQVEIVGGDFWNAYASTGQKDLEGDEALACMLFETPRWLEANPLLTLPQRRQIRGDASGVLERAAGRPSRGNLRLISGGRTDSVTDPGNGASVSRIEPSRSEDPFEALFETGLSAALARDYRRAVESFEQALALSPGDPRVRYNLERLRQAQRPTAEKLKEPAEHPERGSERRIR